ncbi:hypothetical protein [Halarsenatibacter silvermanii]|uniref:Outer membrane protein beta-barrel domain-containing protein n=1 Tax=Halarsenatibacter silvermanii TaxID=321763 RepID=A0A1G9QN86_9FIRM|nr:hypothetical protein [Halarsenatibacter silvermanii]SDM12458.1 hypothetical protein SAMN04488692_11746 [Halarsenatibacter silvermanii]
MKRIVIIILSAIIIITLIAFWTPENLSAETDALETDPEMLERGLAGLNLRVSSGLSGGFMRMNITDLNDSLEDEGFPSLSRNIFIYGFEAVVGRIEGQRLRTIYRRGSVDSRSGDNHASLNIEYGGLAYERGKKVGDEGNMDAALGAMIGAGKKELYLRADEPREFEEFLGEVYDGEHSSAAMEKSFLALKLNSNLHYDLRNSLALGLSAGYLLTHDLGGGWEVGGTSLDEDPTSNLRGPQLSLQISYTF